MVKSLRRLSWYYRLSRIAVFLRDLVDRETEMNRLADIATEILYNDGEFVHAMPYSAGSYNEQTALMQEIHTEGIDL